MAYFRGELLNFQGVLRGSSQDLDTVVGATHPHLEAIKSPKSRKGGPQPQVLGTYESP